MTKRSLLRFVSLLCVITICAAGFNSWCAAGVGRISPADLSHRLFGGNYAITQDYLTYWAGNPTPDHKHAGIDFGAPNNTTVYAVRGGTVINAGGPFGTVAVFDGVNTILYLHMQHIAVSNGSHVQAGTVVGHVGSVGASSPHLHIEVRRGWHDLAVGPTSQPANTALLTWDPLQYLL